MSILYGFYRADSGSIEVGGRPAVIGSPAAAIAAGIGMVHQHFMLVEPLTVLENVLLGAPRRAARWSSCSCRRCCRGCAHAGGPRRRPIVARRPRGRRTPRLRSSARRGGFRFFILLLDASLRVSVPLVLASLAGLFSERSGIVDIGLEGKMLGPPSPPPPPPTSAPRC